MPDDKCKQDATCIASTKNFLKLQNKAEGLATTSRMHCKDSKSLAVASGAAAALAVSAAVAAVQICAASGWWFPPLCVAAVAIAAAAAVASAVAAGAAAAALYSYKQSLDLCKAAKIEVSAAYNKMIDDCDKECAAKKQFDCSC